MPLAIAYYRVTSNPAFVNVQQPFMISSTYLFCTFSAFNLHFCLVEKIKDQLDVTCYFISFLMSSTCFGHQQEHATAMLNYHIGLCSWFGVCWGFGGNSTAQSQAPDDGYINVRNMLSS